MIERLVTEESDLAEYRDLLKRLSTLKFKDILRETLSEYQRKGNFVRVYPSKGTDAYDTFFVQARPNNKFLYNMLYTDELMPVKNKESQKLNYKLDIPQSYEYYKNKPKPALEQKIE